MRRRDFIEAGIGGVAALSVAQGMSRAQNASTNLPSASEIIVIGVDGSDLTVRYLNDYLNSAPPCGSTPGIP